MKKFLLLFATMFMAMTLVGCLESEEVEYSDYTYLSLEMNPAVDFVIDPQGNVYTYQFRNEEAEIVAAGLELVGKNYEEALQLYLNAAVDTGYIDVTRNDNAVIIQSGGQSDEDNEAFLAQVETKMQNFFQENYLGAVILKNQEVDEEAKELVETYEISYGFAKMVLAYMAQNEDSVLEDVLEMQPKDLLDAIVTESNAYMIRYQNQVQAGAQVIKDELVETLQAQVQAHRQLVEDDEATEPDTTGVKEMYQNNFQSMHQAYMNRNQLRLQTAKDNVADQAPMYFSVNINPSVDFILDGNGYVLSYKLNNEDAEIVAAGLEMEGLHYQEALRLYLNAAIQTGYIDVERNDNGVMIQNSGVNQELENAFMNQTQEMLQKFFEEKRIGAVIMHQNEIDPEIVALADEYDISYGFAKLVLTYLATDETLVLEDVLLMSPKEIMDLLEIECEAYMYQYRNQVEAGAQAIKDELVEALRLRIQQHEEDVEDGEIEVPDTTGVREMYLINYEQVLNGYKNRNQTRVQEAKNALNNKAV